MIIFVGGVVGAGKSSVAQGLARQALHATTSQRDARLRLDTILDRCGEA